MVFNSSFGTAIQTLLFISEVSKTQKITSDVIADYLGTSPVVVRRLLKPLKAAGFITVAPRNDIAGTAMAMPLYKISLSNVFEAVEPDYQKIILEPTVRLGRQSYMGIYANEVIAGYVDITLTAVQDALKSITLADALDTLLSKEAENQHNNPRELFSKTEK